MKNKAMLIVCFILMMIVVSGCGFELSEISLGDLGGATATMTATSTLVPTFTPTLTSTPMPTPTSTPAPTNTPTATFTPTPLPTNMPAPMPTLIITPTIKAGILEIGETWGDKLLEFLEWVWNLEFLK